jgi:hypothetical protein
MRNDAGFKAAVGKGALSHRPEPSRRRATRRTQARCEGLAGRDERPSTGNTAVAARANAPEERSD